MSMTMAMTVAPVAAVAAMPLLTLIADDFFDAQC
jgi:hypothetical protein